MPLTRHTDYWDDPAATGAFQDFMIALFNLDFTRWREAGYWDDDYRPISYFDGDRVVSNVCVYSLPMVVDGRAVRVAQLSAVGTLPDCRGRGLNRALTRIAEERALAAHPFLFLFADDEALPFYRKLGFRAAIEAEPVLPVRGAPPRPGARKLDLSREDERALLYGLARRRAPVSDRLGVLSAKLLMFHALYTLRDRALYIPQLEVVAFCKRDATRLTVYDVVGRELPPWPVLYPFLADESDTEIAFGFWPDRLGIPDEIRLRELTANNLHVKGEFDTSRPVLFPFTAHA
jgi:ribosomal protein S18 acetylase RimI-like enzyme